MVDPSDIGEAPGQLLPEDERKRVLSATRLQLTLTAFVVTILLALSVVFFLGGSQIFGWLTPSIRADLQHKAQRGAIELSESAQLGIVVRQTSDIAETAKDYVSDHDVVAIVAQDAQGNPLFTHRRSGAAAAECVRARAQARARPRRRVRRMGALHDRRRRGRTDRSDGVEGAARGGHGAAPPNPDHRGRGLLGCDRVCVYYSSACTSARSWQ